MLPISPVPKTKAVLPKIVVAESTRSHALDFLLSQYLGKDLYSAIILPTTYSEIILPKAPDAFVIFKSGGKFAILSYLSVPAQVS